MYCIILTVRRHALIVHMLIKHCLLEKGLTSVCTVVVAGCNENLPLRNREGGIDVTVQGAWRMTSM